MSSSQRFESLDSLRGVAALVVLVHHLMISVSGMPELLWSDSTSDRRFGIDWMHLISFSPLHFFWDGSAAVVMFFVLSGFVLTVAIQAKPIPYHRFLIKRVIRIWLPFSVAMLFALALWFATKGISVGAPFSSWLVGASTPNVTLKTQIGGFLLSGRYADMSLNPVMWSLGHELRISALMPIIVMLVLRFPVAASVIVLATLIPGYFSDYGVGAAFISQSLEQTVLWTPLFFLGAALAISRAKIAASMARLHKWQVFTLWVACIFLMEARWIVGLTPFANFISCGVASGLIVALAFGSNATRDVLHHDILRWLGRISYPLYLTHFLVLVLVARIASHFGVGLAVSLTTAFVLALVVAHVFQRLVDRPMIALARDPSLLLKNANQPG